MAASCYLGLQNIWDCAAIFATQGFRGALLLPIVAQATQGKRGVKHVYQLTNDQMAIDQSFSVALTGH